MPKSYGILYRAATNSITIPVKAPTNAFDGSVQFAGGYPAIFGGTNIAGGVGPTISAEVTQESRRTYGAPAAGPFTQYFQGQPPHDDLTFFWTSNFAATGTPWGPPANRDEGEMLSVVTVPITGNFTDQDPPNTVLNTLIALTGAPGGTAAQEAEFFASETAVALVQFVYSVVPLSDDERAHKFDTAQPA
jgi:hypothetical protein